MPRVDVVRETPISKSPRARQLEGMFDVPRREVSRVEWHADMPIDDRPWNVGLIVGPSGSGKSTIAREVFGAAVDHPCEWGAASVIDDFDASLSMEQIAAACSAVGFNTIPSWLRPYAVLSNGERFRVELARRLLEAPDPIVVDEFTSVVDRQVAQIGSHAVQKMVRKAGKRFVAVTCHYDVIDWLQPDWTFEPATGEFAWRSVRSRPQVECDLRPVRYDVWRLFAPFHYLTADLNRAARCFCLFIGDRPVAFAGVLARPGRSQGIMGVSRLVTLPDWQGLGLAFALVDRLGGLYKAVGKHLHTYPAHPALVRNFDKSPVWQLRKAPGISNEQMSVRISGARASPRPNAVFRYVGPAMDRADAERVLSFWRSRR